MFSKACEYAIRSMILIASKSRKGEKVMVQDVSREIGSPQHFTAKILQDLTRKGLLQSLKGPTGGFFLPEHGEKLPLARIVEAVDGDQLMKGCALGLKECSEAKPCPVHNQFVSIRDNLSRLLETTTIGALSRDLKKQKVFLVR